MGQGGSSVSGFLLSYLLSTDERLLEYLDNEDELSHESVQRLRLYASAMVACALAPAQVMEDWPDWFHLAPAFVIAYASPQLEELEYSANFLRAGERHDGVSLTAADRAYLEELELQLDMYPEMRAITER